MGRIAGLTVLLGIFWAAPGQAEVAIAAKAGTLGAGAELTLGIAPRLSARVGANAFNYSDRREASQIEYDAEARLRTATGLLDWHRRLIALRRSEPALSTGSFDDLDVRYDEDRRWLVVDRGPVSIVSNFASERRQVPEAAGTEQVLLASADPVIVDASLILAPESVVVVRRPA